MQTSQKIRSSGAAIHKLYHEPEPIEPFRLTGSHFQILNNNDFPHTHHQETVVASSPALNEQFFTLESSPVIEYSVYKSPLGGSVSSNSRSPLSPQASSQSCLSNLHHSSPEKTYGSTISNGVEQALREMEIELLGPGSDFEDGSITSSFDNKNEYRNILQHGISNLDVKQTLIGIAHALDDGAKQHAEALMEALESKVSVTGDPIQRLDLAKRPGGPPRLRVTGVDDGDSSYARGGGLHLVGERLAKIAEAHGVPFEFHAAAISGSDVQWGNLRVQPGEALAINFPYMLHHMPDESVSTINHRDRLIRLVKRLTPKVVTLLEQESNTNTSCFSKRFEEALDYYTAMFESIDAKLPRNIVMPRDDRRRISAEANCVARDMVNIVACEDTDRVERHEPLAKWKFRLQAAGFTAQPLSYSAVTAVQEVLSEYSDCYRLGQKDGALVLGWKNKPMVTCSAWT
ncbi:hypothetical protein L1987_63370 [Smallanthus sonchifolius]|uniref:Uncharacterized protein n=1 Tax=Smallanthus sonchifolius TaxID=185202 RepID=A0ACB9CD40_9ASTR|nr:hypothetical protein L1987_63370 [Smallanthus sonchifolius]